MLGITTSIFDFLKIGPGPSSSHTIAPMKAAYMFMEHVRCLPKEERALADRLEVRLFGSLSATGEGHGTDRAVLCGLLGNTPESCTTEALTALLDSSAENRLATMGSPSQTVEAGTMGAPCSPHILDLGDGYTLPHALVHIIFDAVQHEYPHSNTLAFRLYSGKKCLVEQTYFSIGGGFLRWPNWVEPVTGIPVYPYNTMAELKAVLAENTLSLHELMLANETAITGLSAEDTYAKLDQLMDVMEQAVLLGITTRGFLPGPIGLQRKAALMYAKAKQEHFQGEGFLKALNAYALAVSEENAAGHCIVTAPTCGAAGVIPAIIFMLKHHMGVEQKAIREGLLAATAVGFLCKHNASISGAEVGCQGEIGVASAMAAALITYAVGFSFESVENAAEIAMEHHLGLTCDPVGGYVQIPCIERNAMGVVKAYNAYLIASTIDSSYHKVDFDKAVAAMAQTGRDMSCKYKETSLAGLAQSMAEC